MFARLNKVSLFNYYVCLCALVPTATSTLQGLEKCFMNYATSKQSCPHLNPSVHKYTSHIYSMLWVVSTKKKRMQSIQSIFFCIKYGYLKNETRP